MHHFMHGMDHLLHIAAGRVTAMDAGVRIADNAFRPRPYSLWTITGPLAAMLPNGVPGGFGLWQVSIKAEVFTTDHGVLHLGPTGLP